MKYTKIGFSTLFVAILAYALAISPAFAIAVVDNGTTAMTPAPATVDNGNTSAPATIDNGNTSAPATVDNGNTAGGPVTPPVDNGGGNPGNGGGGNTGGGPSTPPVVTTSGGSTGSSGYGFAGPSGSGSSLPALINISGCTYLTTYMKLGAENNASEVTKLQSFLKNTELLTVDINGTFDQKTFDAVSVFQAKYASDVLTPWGVSTPTGEVYFTTQKKVNELYCKATFSLTAEQLAIITAYRKAVNTQQTDVTVDIGNSSTTTATSTDVGLINDHGQTASAVGGIGAAVSKFFGGAWNWVKWLFGVNKK